MFFSIIIPSYNRSRLILDTLDSIKKQNFDDFEVIIVDDGSIDNTEETVKKYIEINKLKNWFYYYKKNEERGAARNFGITKAKGQFVTFLDSDDIIYPNHLSEAFFFIKNHQPKVFHQAYEIKNINTKRVNPIKYPTTIFLNTAILKGNLLSCFGVFITSHIIKQHLFNENRALSGSEDWLLWLQLSARYPILLNKTITGALIEHESRSVLNFKEEELLKRADLLVKNLKNDAVFYTKFGLKQINYIYGHMLTYTALHLILSNIKMKGLGYFFKGLKYAPCEFFTKRMLVIFYRCILK